MVLLKKSKPLQSELKIASQTQAERDNFLIDCFLDNDSIQELLDNRYSFIAGRKGTGKTAIAKYLQDRHEQYDIDAAERLTLSHIGNLYDGDDGPAVESFLKFLIIRAAQFMLENKLMHREGIKFWKSYLESQGMSSLNDHKEWSENTRKTKESAEAGGDVKVLKANVYRESENSYEKTTFLDTPTTLLDKLIQSADLDKRSMIIIDDLTDQLDDLASKDEIENGLSRVKRVMHRLHDFNSRLLDKKVDLTFVSTVREDLWEFINGSNENKLINDCLWIRWDEEAFCKLLIKRLPHFAEHLDDALRNPTESIRIVFPDELFEPIFKNMPQQEIRRYSTKFYAYMQLISFNRPRDFLRFCHAMRNRLSQKNPIEFKSIESSEQEYSDYFYKELNDEFYLFTKLSKFSVSDEILFKVIKSLSEEESFSFGHLREKMSRILGKSGHGSTFQFLNHLWVYSLVGVMVGSDVVRFKHTDTNWHFPDKDTLKNYRFILHRGLYWRIRKHYKTSYGTD